MSLNRPVDSRHSVDVANCRVCPLFQERLDVVWFAVEGGPHQSCHHGPISNVDVETRDLQNGKESVTIEGSCVFSFTCRVHLL